MVNLGFCWHLIYYGVFGTNINGPKILLDFYMCLSHLKKKEKEKENKRNCFRSRKKQSPELSCKTVLSPTLSPDLSEFGDIAPLDGIQSQICLRKMFETSQVFKIRFLQWCNWLACGIYKIRFLPSLPEKNLWPFTKVIMRCKRDIIRVFWFLANEHWVITNFWVPRKLFVPLFRDSYWE